MNDRKHVGPIWAACCVLMLTGCAAVYEPPLDPAKPTARLRLVTPQEGAEFFRARVEQCPELDPRTELEMVALTPGKERSKLGMIGSSGEVELRIRERLIVADQPYLLVIRSVLDTSVEVQSCVLNGIFLPRAGAQYEASFVYAKDSPSCVLTVAELSQDASGTIIRTPEPSFRRMNRGETYCEAAGSLQR